MKRQQLNGQGTKTIKGLGDLIETVTTFTGIKAATEAVSKATGKDCGCAKRRDALNERFPFGKENDNAD